MPDRYIREWFTPRVPSCARSTLTLRFDGQALRAHGSSQLHAFPAVLGRQNGGTFVYSVGQQQIPDQGPIPAGDYWIQPSELQENSWYRLRNPRPAWGDYWITIHPYPNTVTYKRGGFFIHGGRTLGSAGCIDLSVYMNQFVDSLKRELKGHVDCFIPLTVRYAS
ncbi:tlde1 domain-containing protein [Noviherbaspirillum sp. Root189]|uniref:tlde1 domain-containing protein n=1 Tax=Noviherbaspirillum sp. Root189 TaxID=1736487 RepID=UPI0009EAD4AA|nr:tlde1 domain-containing protein [Noviherbaspirillum sp. Root189]